MKNLSSYLALDADSLQKAFLYSLLFCFFVAILPKHAFQGDISFWLAWTRRIHDHGLGEIYNLRTEYHPFFLYLLWVFQWIMGTMEEVHSNVNYVKVFPLIFDFIGALSVFFILKKEQNKLIYPFFLLFNIAYMYNTMLWGQVDSIHTTLVLLSTISVLKNRVLLSLVFFVLAINMKLQAIIYLPVLGLLWLQLIFEKPKLILKGLGVIIGTQLIILIPFILADSLPGLWKVVTEANGRHPFVSMNAYNLWFYFAGEYPAGVLDKTVFALGYSYKTWGLSLFLLFSTIALFPLLRTTFYRLKTKKVDQSYLEQLTFISLALVTIVFFYFNTQMHERYTHSAIIFFFFYSVKSKNFWLYILCSLGYLLNMESVLKYWQFNKYGTLIFNEQFIASIFGLVLLISFYQLYNYRSKSTLESV